MKKSFFIIIYFSLFIVLFANEIFIQEEGRIYKVTLSENGDTLSKEEIQIIPLDTIAMPKPVEEVQEETKEVEVETKSELYNPQLLRIVPFKWQAGWYGAWQGFPYGLGIVYGFGIVDKRYAPLIYLSVPSLMFFLPPMLIKDDVPDYSLAFIDWGYRLGPMDYTVLRAAFSKGDIFLEDTIYLNINKDALLSIATGYSQSWGGYTLARKLGPFRRATSDMYAAGAYMGYIWGGLTGYYISLKVVADNPEYAWNADNADSIENEIRLLDQERELYIFSTAFLFSLGFRATGFYFGNQEKYNLKSFDGYFYTFNSIPGFLLTNEIDNYIDIENEIYLVYTGLSMLTTGVTAYIMKDIHLDDGNAILMFIGGIVGGSLGQGIERVIAGYGLYEEGKMHTSIGALCMIAGEVGVYYLRKDAIKSGSDFGSNLGFNLYPTNNNGMGVNLSYSF